MKEELKNLLDYDSVKTLAIIEYSVESRLNPPDEQVTIIAHPVAVENMKKAIAKGLLFSKNYSQLIFNSDPTLSEEEMIIIPDHVIEEVIQQNLKDELDSNEEVKEKMKILNDKMGNIPEEQLIRISQTKDEDLSEEELALKNEIQFAMLEVGMNLDLQFQDSEKQNKIIDKVLDEVLQSDKSVVVQLKGETNE
ncbi:MAG: hypothetical protein IJH34_05965 [Romboutsia sp.]|nr:hypothetical protein [Romboutsia sp.]